MNRRSTIQAFYCNWKVYLNVNENTCPVQSPTTRSAMNVSSVSPERWLTITPQPLAWASLHLKKQKKGYKESQQWNIDSKSVRDNLWVSELWFDAMWLAAVTHAWMASVTEPIWLTFKSRQLQARSSAAFSILLGFVTVRSSPTIWIPTVPVIRVQAAQSSWSKGSSIDTTVHRKHKRKAMR